LKGKYERLGGEVTTAETWEEYRKLVLSELERFEQKANAIDRRIHQLDTSVTELKTKMGVVAALVGVALALLNIILRFWP